MNYINTSFIVDPNSQQPFLGKSLRFLQNATTEILLALAETIIGETYDISIPYILKGVTPYGTNQYTSGYILWNGTIFHFPGKDDTDPFVHVPVLNFDETPDFHYDPVTFSDGSSKNVHLMQTYVMADAVSGDILLSDCVYLHKEWTNIPVGTDFTAVGKFQYRKNIGNIVEIRGQVHSSASPTHQIIGTLPVGFRPLEVTRRLLISIQANNGLPNTVEININGEITLITTVVGSIDYSISHSFSIE